MLSILKSEESGWSEDLRNRIQMLVADKHQHTNLANITVDQAIKNNIHMDVVIEEDPDEEKGE